MPSVVNYQLLRYQSDNIPLFDGNPRLLNRFIIAIENLLKAFYNRTDPNDTINVCLFDTILSKLTGRAADLITSRIELNSWNLIKEVLINSFSDQRSIDCLIQDLINLKPFKNESPLEFGMRIQDSRSLLFSKLNATSDSNETKLIKIKHYDEFALKTFINGLSYNLQLVVRLKSPSSIEQAMSFVREEENFIQFKNVQNFGQNTGNFNRQFKPNVRSAGRPSFSHNFSQTPISSFNTQWPQNNHPPRPFSNFAPHNNSSRPIFPNFNQPNSSRTSYSNFNHANFSRHPFNNFNNHSYQPRHNFPFNNQSGNSRKIPFTPRPPFGQRSHRSNINQNPVEPMDTSSGNTIIHDPKRNFISQELYNQEVLPQSPEELSSDNDYHFHDTYKNPRVNNNSNRSSNHYEDYKREDRNSNFPSTSRNMDTT